MWPVSHPTAMTANAPVVTSISERSKFGPSRVTTDSTVPKIGVISGATIIAPMTGAVAFPTTPADAITADRTSRTQKRLSLRPRCSPSNRSSPRIRAKSEAAIDSIPRRTEAMSQILATQPDAPGVRPSSANAPGSPGAAR